MPRDETFLLYMLLASCRIDLSTKNISRAEFDRNEEKKDSVVLQLGNIGEAANRISKSFQIEHPEVPWKDIIGMRHRLFHSYEDIDWDTVWKAATVEVTALLRALEPLVPPEEKP
jgi:uncharacterized protein with HEPN domain